MGNRIISNVILKSTHNTVELPDHPDERPFLSSKTSPFRLPGKQTLDHQGPPSFKIAQLKKKKCFFFI